MSFHANAANDCMQYDVNPLLADTLPLLLQAMAQLPKAQAAMIEFARGHSDQATRGLALLPGARELLAALKVKPGRGRGRAKPAAGQAAGVPLDRLHAMWRGMRRASLLHLSIDGPTQLWWRSSLPCSQAHNGVYVYRRSAANAIGCSVADERAAKPRRGHGEGSWHILAMDH